MNMTFAQPLPSMPIFPACESMRFLNVSNAPTLVKEIVEDDFYKLDWIPDGSVIFDVGGCFGEFGLICAAEKKCKVFMYEASEMNWIISGFNYKLNEHLFGPEDVAMFHAAIGGKHEIREFQYCPTHPAGSGFHPGWTEQITEKVQVLRLSDQIVAHTLADRTRPICVKLDCEGAERQIFDEDPGWLDMVDQVTMEWHEDDGKHYHQILLSKGFKVKLHLPRKLGMLFASKI